MVHIRPFRGLRYDPDRAGDPADLLAPPYDVIDGAGRAQLASRSQYNCVHVILPEGDADARYAKGAARFRAMIREALTTDDAAGYYVYHQAFTIEGRAHTRKGFVALVELTDFGAGEVLPHERTLKGPKRDRLALMRACEAHLELVFGLFSDPGRGWEVAVGDLGDPVLACEFDEVHHSLYRVSDPAHVEALTEHLAQRPIYIADGHHRYETMCTFRDELSARAVPGARFGMIYLSNLDDPGLVVLPTHRLVHGLASLDQDALWPVLDKWFSIEDAPLPADAAALRVALDPGPTGRATFGLHVPGEATMRVLRLRPDYEPAAAGLGELPEALQRLDVVVLHELVLERALGVTKAAQEAKTNLRYYKSTEAALEVARESGSDTQLVCFMNATPVADVRAVCDSGEVMPQKSTFFFPKIPTGLVFHDLRPDED